MCTTAVPRKPGDACGALVRLRRPDGSVLVNNVEYNEVSALLAAHGVSDLDERTGVSPFPGNTNQILVRLSTYLACLGETKGIVPEFVNPKYADETRSRMLAPSRLECMMQDFPKLLAGGADPRAQVSFVELQRWICYSPVKNSAKQGAALAERGLPPMTPSAGEFDLYDSNRRLLRLAGVEIADAPASTFLGVPVVPGPRIVLAPSFALGTGDVMHKVKGGLRLAPRSARPVERSARPRGCAVVRMGVSCRAHLRALHPDRVRAGRASDQPRPRRHPHHSRCPGRARRNTRPRRQKQGLGHGAAQGRRCARSGGVAGPWVRRACPPRSARAAQPLRGTRRRGRRYQLVKYEQRVIEFKEPGEFVCSA